MMLSNEISKLYYIRVPYGYWWLFVAIGLCNQTRQNCKIRYYVADIENEMSVINKNCKCFCC